MKIASTMWTAAFFFGGGMAARTAIEKVWFHSDVAIPFLFLTVGCVVCGGIAIYEGTR